MFATFKKYRISKVTDIIMKDNIKYSLAKNPKLMYVECIVLGSTDINRAYYDLGIQNYGRAVIKL